MPNHRRPDPGHATIRITGPTDTVDEALHAITTALPGTITHSRSYPSRHNPQHTRIYLEVNPR